MTRNEALLLDTAAAIALSVPKAAGVKLSRRALERVVQAQAEGHLFLSAFSAWETALKADQKKLPLRVDAREWYRQILAVEGIHEAPLDADILIASVQLEWRDEKGKRHGDPVDRIIVAQALRLHAAVVTSDRRMHMLASQRKDLVCLA